MGPSHNAGWASGWESDQRGDAHSVLAADRGDVIASAKGVTEDSAEEVIFQLGFRGEVGIHQQEMSFGPDHRRRQAEGKGRNNNNGSYIRYRWSARYGSSHLIFSAAPWLYPFSA